MDGVVAYVNRTDANNKSRAIATFDFTSVGSIRASYAIASALSGDPSWKPELAQSLVYITFADRMDYFWHEQFRILFPQHRHPMAMMNWEQMTHTLAFCALLGWTDAAVYQGYLTHASLNRRFQLEESYGEQHRRAHAFMLRLFADWRADGTGHQWPAWAYEVPVYEDLLKRWRTHDDDELRRLLVRACDRHTHESKFDTATAFYDFGDDLLTHTPVEILLLLRLRQLTGLSTPQVDHPLMQAPFDRLPEPMPVPPADDLMTATLARAEKDWPKLAGATSLESVSMWARNPKQ